MQEFYFSYLELKLDFIASYWLACSTPRVVFKLRNLGRSPQQSQSHNLFGKRVSPLVSCRLSFCPAFIEARLTQVGFIT